MPLLPQDRTTERQVVVLLHILMVLSTGWAGAEAGDEVGGP